MPEFSRRVAKAKRAKPAAEAGAGRGAKGDLTRYRSMRDFSVTPEPSGEVRPSAADLRFVIQKHAARRLHYDLRLELDGVYKSWAVTRGPSLDPQQKRLAVHVEDHPIDYGDFEGTIPKGEYGGGTVMIWDRGVWRPEGDPDQGYAKGHLAFELVGRKLRGRWHLVRTHGRAGEKKEQWLLFKADDGYARPGGAEDILEAAPNSVATGRTMEEIAEHQDAVWSSRGGLVKGGLSRAPAASEDAGAKKAKAGAAVRSALDAASIAGATRSGLPDFIDPCLAQLVEKPPETDAWLHEIKLDGYRIVARIAKGRATLKTRKGQDWTVRFPTIAEALGTLSVRSAIFDGEAVIEDESGVTNFSALQDALTNPSGAAAARFFAFDLLYLDGYDLRGATLDTRKTALLEVLRANTNAAVRFVDHIVGSGRSMFEHACRLGLEGIVSKRRNAPYRSGRHGEWLKCKCVNREEFVIGGYVVSTASRNAVGALALGYYRDGKLEYAGRTGTGFTRQSAETLWRALAALRIGQSPFTSALTTDEKRGVVFVEPKLVAQVEFRGWTDDGRLRQAAFKGLREDKPAGEVELEMPKEQSEAAARGAEKPASAKARNKAAARVRRLGGSAEFAGVTLTHPDRILWEGEGVTKLGLAEYYASVADRMLPHIVERPLALLRCPDGTSGTCFFQKHSFAGLPEAVEVAEVEDKEGMAEALVIHDLGGLISLVQASALEIHPWGARVDDTERPDKLIFDLDPGEGVDWPAVIDAAREVRGRLEAFGIASFVKTSGGKGLHVVSHLKPQVGWDELKAFAHSIALAMEADDPSRYISTMAKRARGGKIFVDYLRNGRGATAVAPYSTRARPGAPISTPVRWDELGPALTPARFAIGNIGRRLSALRSDPWEGFFADPQDIAKAISLSEQHTATAPRRERGARKRSR